MNHPAQPAPEGATVPILLPLRVIEREKDGSIYLESGDPSGNHLAFDVACNFAEATYLAEATNAYAVLRARCERLEGGKVRLRQLANLWDEQAATYPADEKGIHAAAAVICCARELRAALAQPEDGK